VSDGSEVRLIGVTGLPEVQSGDDLPALIADAIEAAGTGLEHGDIVVVTHKIVSKAEGQVVDLRSIEPSVLAQEHSRLWDKDPRKTEIVLREARRIVRMTHGLIIAETAHGFVCANAGVDASNASADVVVLLPVDPDASAARLRATLGSGLASQLTTLRP
jgi:coenzyme F420-0:L-glutamate ligase/coenzyme F420-1:gamma-L-glutamate ligase